MTALRSQVFLALAFTSPDQEVMTAALWVPV